MGPSWHLTCAYFASMMETFTTMMNLSLWMFVLWISSSKSLPLVGHSDTADVNKRKQKRLLTTVITTPSFSHCFVRASLAY
jgi:hypothetical protein